MFTCNTVSVDASALSFAAVVMPMLWIPARALIALLAVHTTAQCAIAILVALVIVDGASPVGVIVTAGFCVSLVVAAVAVYFGVAGLQRRGHHNSAAALASVHALAPPLALGCFLY